MERHTLQEVIRIIINIDLQNSAHFSFDSQEANWGKILDSNQPEWVLNPHTPVELLPNSISDENTRVLTVPPASFRHLSVKKTTLTMSHTLETLWSQLTEHVRIPRSFYRLQFSPSFTFKDAKELVPYLDALGISDLYASPIFKPRTGSTHGYDTVDYNELNPVLGSLADFDHLCEALKEREMSLLLDIVPNHMGVSTGKSLVDRCASNMDLLRSMPHTLTLTGSLITEYWKTKCFFPSCTVITARSLRTAT